MSSSRSTAIVATFSQQGSVDWVDLAKVPVQLTVGTLSRLSRARIEAITFHAALFIFSPAEFSDQGQIRVHSAIQKSASYPTFSKALWLGFGIKHILHDFATTHEGLACVGIVGALTEQFTLTCAAGIISELWKLKRLPADYSPALHQWAALVEACGGVLATTDFPLLLGEIMRQYLSDGASNIRAASSPKAVAEVLHAVFEASKKKVREVHITGGCDSAWVAAVAHWLLGMSVEIVDGGGITSWASSDDASGEHTKLVIMRDSSTTDKLQIVKRCHVLDGGHSLVPGLWDEDTRWKIVSLGRAPWATCLIDIFGTPAKKLLVSYGETAGWCLGSAARVFEAYMCNEYAPGGNVRDSPPPNSASTARGFVTAARNLLPELRLNNGLVESMEQAIGQPLHGAQREYSKSMSSLHALCGCNRCSLEKSHQDNQFCMVQLIPFICTIVRIFSSMRMPQDLSILPSIAGMEQVYWEHIDFNRTEATKTWMGLDLLSLIGLLFSCAETYKSISNQKSTRRSAVSVNGLCFYTNTICNPTGSPDQATLAHIVPGRIYFNDFAYDEIVDDEDEIRRSESYTTEESAFFCESVRSIDSYEDVVVSPTEGLQSELNVVEMVDYPRILKLSYHITQKNGKGTIKFGPRQLFNEICYAYTASDCRGKDCTSPNGVRSIWANGNGYITSDSISPLGPAPIIRVLPGQSLEILVALTQNILKDDPKLAKSLRHSTQLTAPSQEPPKRIFLRKQLQGNQCIRCCLKNIMEGPRIESNSFQVKRVCILNAFTGAK